MKKKPSKIRKAMPYEKKVMSITEVCKRAKKEGISYGEYVKKYGV